MRRIFVEVALIVIILLLGMLAGIVAQRVFLQSGYVLYLERENAYLAQDNVALSEVVIRCDKVSQVYTLVINELMEKMEAQTCQGL